MASTLLFPPIDCCIRIVTANTIIASLVSDCNRTLDVMHIVIRLLPFAAFGCWS